MILSFFSYQSDPNVTPEKRQLSPITEAPAPKRGKAVDVGLPGAPSNGRSKSIEAPCTILFCKRQRHDIRK